MESKRIACDVQESCLFQWLRCFWPRPSPWCESIENNAAWNEEACKEFEGLDRRMCGILSVRPHFLKFRSTSKRSAQTFVWWTMHCILSVRPFFLKLRFSVKIEKSTRRFTFADYGLESARAVAIQFSKAANGRLMKFDTMKGKAGADSQAWCWIWIVNTQSSLYIDIYSNPQRWKPEKNFKTGKSPRTIPLNILC